MEQTPTTRDQYLQNANQTKKVKLLSGNVFEIRKVSSRQVRRQSLEINLHSYKEFSDKSMQEKMKILSEKADKDKLIEESLKFSEKIICLAVINPKISLEKNDTDLHIDEIIDEDYTELMNHINEFSLGGSRQNLESFRKE